MTITASIRFRFYCTALMAACWLSVGPAASSWAGESFLKDGDRWLFLGDSITHNDTYRRTIERVVRHFHPGITFETGNSAFRGATSGVKVSAPEKKPTVVSVMLGMNNAINSAWRCGQPMQPFLDDFRADMTAKARRVQGARRGGYPDDADLDR